MNSDDERNTFETKTTSRRTESKKLLAHVLDQLSSRPMPPSVLYNFNVQTDDSGGDYLGGLVRQAMKVAPANQADAEDDDEDEPIGREFSTDRTFELMTQLREVLILSVSQGWQIFEDG